MKNFPWFKAYLIITIFVCVAFLGFNLFAQVEETNFDLKYYIKGQDSSANCPDFVEINALTMKDSCTGLVWARNELPTYHGAAEPGYTWDEAQTACADYLIDPTSGKSIFRLPTVEELLSLVKYKCDEATCSASFDYNSIVGSRPFFAGGRYWSINDFNEPSSWTDPNLQPLPGNPQRDYKRSVNILSAEVDTPVFNKLMRANAWCVVDRTPEIISKSFSSVTTAGITNGTIATGGQMKIIYNRNCTLGDTTSNDSCEVRLPGTTCENITDLGSKCVGSQNFDASNMDSKIVDCNEGYHIEDNNCVPSPDAPNPPECPTDETVALGINAYQAWKGNAFNGNLICRVDDCGRCTNDSSISCSSDAPCLAGGGTCDNTIAHRDPDSEICVENKRPCFKEDSTGWTLRFVEDWNTTTLEWGECRADICTFDATPQGSPASCQCSGTVDPETGICTNIDVANQHYEINLDYTTREDCLNNSGSWDGDVCYDVAANNPGTDCSIKYCYDGSNFSSNYCQLNDDCLNSCVDDVCSITGDSCQSTVCPAYSYNQCQALEVRNEIWNGSLFIGSYECSFINCASGYHQDDNGFCVSDVRTCDPFPVFADVATQTWTGSDWGSCVIQSCVSNSTAVGSPITACQCVESAGPTGVHPELDNTVCSLNEVSCSVNEGQLNNIYGLIASASEFWDGTWGDCEPMSCSLNKRCATGLAAGVNFTDTNCDINADCTDPQYPYCFPSKASTATVNATEPYCTFDQNNSISGTISERDNPTNLISGAMVFLKNRIKGFTNIATIAANGSVSTQAAVKKCAQKFPALSPAETTCTDDSQCTDTDYPVCLEGVCAAYIPQYSATNCSSDANCAPDYSESECFIDSDCSGVVGYPYCLDGLCANSDKTRCALPVLTNDQIGYNYLVNSVGGGTYSQSGMDIGIYDMAAYKADYFLSKLQNLFVEGAVSQNFQLIPNSFSIRITDTGTVDDYFRVYVNDVWAGDTSPAQPVLNYEITSEGDPEPFKIDIYFKDSNVRYVCPAIPSGHDHLTGFSVNIIGPAEFMTDASHLPSAVNNTTTYNACRTCFTLAQCVSQAIVNTPISASGNIMGEISVYDIPSLNDPSIIPTNAGRATFYINFPSS